MVFLFCQSVRGIFGKTQFCEVETGQTNIILDIEESRGSCKYYPLHFDGSVTKLPSPEKLL